MTTPTTTPTTPTRADVMYARYSSHAQDDSTSIAVQVEACERAAGGTLVRYIDEARTGRSINGRDALQRLIADSEAGKIGRLFVYKYDRLGRAAQTHVLVENLEDCGVEVISVTEGQHSLTRGVQLVVAADYSRVLAERTRDGLVQRHKKGLWTGGQPPYGFRVETGADGKRRLAVHAEEAAVVREVFRLYTSERIGLEAIARRLHERRVPTRRGGIWGGIQVRNILTCRLVVGDCVFLRRKYILSRTTGRRLARPRRDGHAHQQRDGLRIVDDAVFTRAQEILAAHRRATPKGIRSVLPLSGLITCAMCGGPCHLSRSANAKGEYVYIRCGRRQRHGAAVCSNAATARQDVVLERVQHAVTEALGDVDDLLVDVYAAAQQLIGKRVEESALLDRRAADVDARLKRLMELMIAPEVAPGAIRAISRQIEELEQERDLVRAELNASASRSALDAARLLEECRRAIEEARERIVWTADAASVNRMIADVVGPMQLNEKGQITPCDLPRSNSGGTLLLRGEFLAPVVRAAVWRCMAA